MVRWRVVLAQGLISPAWAGCQAGLGVDSVV